MVHNIAPANELLLYDVYTETFRLSSTVWLKVEQATFRLQVWGRHRVSELWFNDASTAISLNRLCLCLFYGAFRRRRSLAPGVVFDSSLS